MKISIIMPVYNGERYLDETMKSVLNQTFKDFEFIIIDDCSTDNTLKILNYWKQKDKRIKIIENKFNIGPTKSLNIGIDNSSGKYIARVDCGDLYDENRLKLQYRFLELNPRCVLVGSQYYIINEEGYMISKRLTLTDYNLIKKELPKRNQFGHSSIMFKRGIGKYDKKFKHSQDYEFVLRLASKYYITNLPNLLMYYRYSTKSISFSKGRQQKIYANKARWKAMRDYGYSKKNIIYLIRPLILSFIPQNMINFIIKKFKWRDK
jgi:glycosyltransferase involved in cell wall biosynthesis